MNRASARLRALCTATVIAALLSLAGLAPAAAAPLATAAIDPGTRNLPPTGTTMSFVGQTAPDLSAYASQVLNDSTFPRPSGVTFYTNITPGVCTGLTGPCNLNGNITDLPSTLSTYPGAALAVGLYLADGPSCTNQPVRALAGRADADIAGGLGAQYRANLDTLVTTLKNTGRQVYLRVGYEFDGPWNCYNNDFYKAAFRYVKERINALGATKVATVWQTASYPQDGNPAYHQDFSNPAHLDAFYPGDDVVDWVGMSTFFFDNTWRDYQWAPGCNQATNAAPQKLYGDVLAFASTHAKPVMIAEAAPAGYRTRQLDGSCVFKNARVALPNVDRLSAWYNAYFDYVTAHKDQIRAAAYINSDWEAITQFACPPGASAGGPGCSDGYWGNSRIQDNATIKALFKTRLGQMMATGGGGGGGGGAVAGGVDLGDGLVRRIQNTANGQCWDVAGGGAPNGVAVTQWTCLENTTATNQDWKLKRVSTPDGIFYQLVAQHSGRCADVSGISKATGAKLLQWDCHASPDAANLRNQLYAVRANADGSYRLVLKHSGLCVDVPNGTATRGTQLQQWTCNNLPPQNFRLIATSHPSGGGTTSGKLLLLGQSSRSGWDDFTSFAGTPDGGSVYYSVKNGGFVGTAHRDYATFLADQGKVVQVGVSWKDDPPVAGADGEASRQSTVAVANGSLDSKFTALTQFINSHRAGRYLLRLDYEVSPYYHCTESTCAIYKNAYNHLATLIRNATPGVDVEFVFHPVRGAQAQMYPGDANVDWIGTSIFNHDMCMPLYAVNTTQYNGTPGVGFDTARNECIGYYDQLVNGNRNAVKHGWTVDLNDLQMMAFAQDHGKKMIVSEASPQNFVAGVGTNGREPESLVSTWVDRLFGMTRYRGPIPNTLGDRDLSNVVQAVTYINIDWRYGFDGATSGPTSGTVDDVWWANSRLSGFGQARTAFCTGLATSGFGVRCR